MQGSKCVENYYKEKEMAMVRADVNEIEKQPWHDS